MDHGVTGSKSHLKPFPFLRALGGHTHKHKAGAKSVYDISLKTVAVNIGVGRGGARPPNNLRGGANIPFGPPIIHPSVPAKLFLSILSLNFL